MQELKQALCMKRSGIVEIAIHMFVSSAQAEVILVYFVRV